MAMLTAGTLAAACATEPPELSETRLPVSEPEPASAHVPTTNQIEAVRSGRYTLVELTPEEGQRDPMRQIVVITIPSAFESTLGMALVHVLARTGFKLCSPPPSFVHLPLPASQLRLGPMTLAAALQTLAGPAWSLTVDHLERKVCFIRSDKP
jgi:type IV pili sensor histidine kinase/response regulator